MTHDLPSDDDGLARKIGAPELELIVGRLVPLAAMGLSSRRTLSLLAPHDDGAAPGLVDLAKWDPAIAANVLAAAGSGRPQPLFRSQVQAPRSVAQAAEALGPQAVQTVVLGSLGRRWPGAAAPGAWLRQEFWRHCIAVALAAEMLTERAALPFSAEEVRTWGLLHDLGKLGMIQAMPKSLARLLESLEAQGGGDLLAREQEVLGADHALIGRRMAQQWRLCEELQEIIWLHHQPFDSPALAGPARQRAGLVQLADAVARMLRIGRSGNSAYPSSCEALAAQLGMDEGVLPAVRDRLPRECARRCEALGVGEADEPGARAGDAVAEASIARLVRTGDALRGQVRSLGARARVMGLVERFARAQRPEAPLPEVLAAAARAVGEATGSPPARERPIVAYALLFEEETVLAVRADGEEKPSCRTLRTRKAGPPPDAKGAHQSGCHGCAVQQPCEMQMDQGTAADGAAVAPMPAAAPGAEDVQANPFHQLLSPAEPEMQGVLETPSALGDWLDPALCTHLGLVCGSRRVGGVLVPNPLPAGAGEVLGPLAEVLGAWLATCLQARRAAALGERLTEAWGRLASQREGLAEAKALRAVGEMAAGAAHEINNPLAVISGRAQLMLARAGTEEEKKVWRLFVAESQRISDLLTSLVELANPARPATEAIAPGNLLSAAAGEFGRGDHPKAASLLVDVQTAADLPRVRADRSGVVEVLRELLANAADAGATRVVLAAKEGPGGAVVLSAADDGAGMDGATLAAAFTPLFSRQAAGRRRGMGLPRARRTVEVLGGRMWIRSEPGAGTTVFVQLPDVG